MLIYVFHLAMYSGGDCTGTVWTDTGYATDSLGGVQGNGEYCNDIDDAYGEPVRSWQMYCTP